MLKRFRMDGDSLKGALFNGSRRLSSGRHVKPKRAFSPDHYMSAAPKKFAKTSATATVSSGLFDSMTRGNLLREISFATPKDFTLPTEYLTERAERDALAAPLAPAIDEAEPSTSAKAEVNRVPLVSSNYDYFIDREALDNVLSYEKQFLRMNSTKKPSNESRSKVAKRKSAVTKPPEHVRTDDVCSPSPSSSNPMPPRKSLRKRNASVRTTTTEPEPTDEPSSIDVQSSDTLPVAVIFAEESTEDVTTENSTVNEVPIPQIPPTQMEEEPVSESVAEAMLTDAAQDEKDVFTMHEDTMVPPEEEKTESDGANSAPVMPEVNTSHDNVAGENLTEEVAGPSYLENHNEDQNYEDEQEEMEYELAPSSPEKSVNDELEHDNSMEYEILSVQSPDASPRPHETVLNGESALEGEKDELSVTESIPTIVESRMPKKSESRDDEDDIKILYEKVPPSTSSSVDGFPINRLPLKRKASNSLLIPMNGQWNIQKVQPSRLPDTTTVRLNSITRRLPFNKKQFPCKTSIIERVRSDNKKRMSTRSCESEFVPVEATATATITALEPVVLPICEPQTTVKVITPTTNGVRSARSSRPIINYASLATGKPAVVRPMNSLSERRPNKTKKSARPSALSNQFSRALRNREQRFEEESATKLKQKLGKSRSAGRRTSASYSVNDEYNSSTTPLAFPIPTASTVTSEPVSSSSSPSPSLLNRPRNSKSPQPVENGYSSSEKHEADSNSNDILVLPAAISDAGSTPSYLPLSVANQFPPLCVKIEDAGNFEHKILHEMVKSDEPAPSVSNSVRKTPIGKQFVVPSVNRPQRHRNTPLSDDFVYPLISNKKRSLQFRNTPSNHRPKLKYAITRKANIAARALPKRNTQATKILDIIKSKVENTADPNERPPPKTYSIYGFAEDAQNLPTLGFNERLAICRALNPLARGVMNPPDMFTNDFFYREVLPVGIRPSDHISFDNEVDVCGSGGVGDALRGEFLVSSPAEKCAADVLDILRPRTTVEDDAEAEDGLDVQLQERAKRESTDVAEHLSVFLRFIFVQRLTDLSTMNTPAGASMFYSMSMANANRLRESLRLYNRKRLHAMVDAHSWLLRNLPVELLAAYLNLLRFLKVAGSNLSRHVVDRSEMADIQAANQIIGQFLAGKMYDPPANTIVKLMSGVEPLKNVCLLLVYPQVMPQESHAQLVRPYETLFKNLLPRVVQVAEKVDFGLESRTSDSVEDCARICVQLIVKHVREIVKRRPNDHVFLAGWGTSCLLNHRAVSLVPGVSGILDFAFPTESAVGPRGEVDDNICLTYCPSLFVVGENSSESALADLAHMRKNLLVDSGLMVVGGANRNLFVSNVRLNTERVSQKCVDRAIVEQVSDFMRIVMDDIGPASNESRELLKPIELPHIYDVDMNSLKHGSLTVEKEVKRVTPLDDTGVENGDHHYTSKEKPRRKYNKSTDKGDRKPRRKKDALNAPDPDLSFLSGPPPGFCTPADSVPVMSNSRGDGGFAAPLTTARNSFSNSLKKAVALGRETIDSTERAIGSMMDVSSPTYVKIPTPSMLNKQLPPPMPTVLSVATVSPRSGEKLSNSSMGYYSPIAEAPQHQWPPSHQRPANVHPNNVFDGGGSVTKFSPPMYSRYHLPHSSPNMPMSASSRPPFPKPSALTQPLLVSQDPLTQFVRDISPAKEKESEKVEQDLIQEEQAAAAALLGQLPDF